MTLNLFVKSLDDLSDWVLLKGVEKSHLIWLFMWCVQTASSCDLLLYILYRGERVLNEGMLLDALY